MCTLTTERKEHDDYPTPSWCVDRLVEVDNVRHLLKYARYALEPCAGSGTIIRALQARAFRHNWTAVELQAQYKKALVETDADVYCPFNIFNFGEKIGGQYDVIITNPPYSLAWDIVHWGWNTANWIILLLRINWLEGNKRQLWLSNHVPDMYVLPNRPSFRPPGTDSTGYAWFVWDTRQRRSKGTYSILSRTTQEDRKRGC